MINYQFQSNTTIYYHVSITVSHRISSYNYYTRYHQIPSDPIMVVSGARFRHQRLPLASGLGFAGGVADVPRGRCRGI